MANVPQRVKLQYLLESILEKDPQGDKDNVHFQPPNGLEMRYPAIVYSRGTLMANFADNHIYKFKQRWSVSVIHLDPDNLVREEIASLPYCSFENSYATEGLNHDVYNLFF